MLISPRQLKKNKYKPLRVSGKQVTRIEKTIDKYNAKLAPLNSFCYLGGLSLRHFYTTRTVTRRTETQIVALAKKEEVNEEAIKYINRLSDLFFVLSRVENNNGKKIFCGNLVRMYNLCLLN